MNRQAYILGGATATGKTAVLQLLAEKSGGMVVSADSMLVYKGMDIGTAKPTVAERSRVTYAGVDVATPAEPCSAGVWLESVKQTIASASGPVYVTGGTGLYIKALTEGLDAPKADPAVRAHWQQVLDQQGIKALQKALPSNVRLTPSDYQNPRRLLRALEKAAEPAAESAVPQSLPRFPVLCFNREVLHRRIHRRVRQMFAMGLEAETKELMKQYPQWSETALGAIGYSETRELLAGQITRAEAVERIVIRTRQLAKRQETWLRHQADCEWIEVDERDSLEAVAARVQKAWKKHGPVELRF